MSQFIPIRRPSPRPAAPGGGADRSGLVGTAAPLNPKAASMREIRPLTSLRALAAFLVFMYHYAWLFPPSTRGFAAGGEWVPGLFLWRQGQVGVSIFFVLSGFLITRIYFDAVVQRRAALRLFFVKRVARIWPLFLLFAAVQHLVQYFDTGSLDRTALVTLSMSQAFFEDLRYRGLPTAWSLTIEESFYALAPVLFLALGAALSWTRREDDPVLDRRRLLGLGVALGAVCVLLAGTGELLVRASVGAGWNWQGFLGSRHHVLHATIFGRFPEFAIGMLAAFIHRGGRLENALRGGRATALAVGSFLAVALILALRSHLDARGLPAGSPLYYALTYGTALLSGVLILGLSVPGGWFHRLLGRELFVYLGRISYGFYLIQLSVLITPLVQLSDQLAWARVPALLVMVNLFCAAVYELVEAPARRAIVRRWGAR